MNIKFIFEFLANQNAEVVRMFEEGLCSEEFRDGVIKANCDTQKYLYDTIDLTRDL